MQPLSRLVQVCIIRRRRAKPLRRRSNKRAKRIPFLQCNLSFPDQRRRPGFLRTLDPRPHRWLSETRGGVTIEHSAERSSQISGCNCKWRPLFQHDANTGTCFLSDVACRKADRGIFECATLMCALLADTRSEGHVRDNGVRNKRKLLRGVFHRGGDGHLKKRVTYVNWLRLERVSCAVSVNAEAARSR